MANVYIRKFPDELWEEIKLQAESEDKIVYKWVITALREALKRSDPSRRWTERAKV